MTLTHTIINQNYLQFNNQYYKQDSGLAMGAPTSAFLAEIFFQHLEHTKIINILNKYHIIDYCRYVDDILIVYNKDITNIENTLIDFNSIHPNIQYTIEKETQNSLNYLDLTITNEQNKLTFSIVRKLTSTDLIIHNDSCHPQEHKYAAINYLTNRLNTYPVTESSKNHEQQQIKIILHNNNYLTHGHGRKSKSNHREQNNH
jgi:glycerol-3-phosphate cytidylyltransferase-like family protein